MGQRILNGMAQWKLTPSRTLISTIKNNICDETACKSKYTMCHYGNYPKVSSSRIFTHLNFQLSQVGTCTSYGSHIPQALRFFYLHYVLNRMFESSQPLVLRNEQLMRKNFLNKSCTFLQMRWDRKSTRLNSSHANISYAVFCLKKKKKNNKIKKKKKHTTSTTKKRT